jgi:hypothetical protein
MGQEGQPIPTPARIRPADDVPSAAQRVYMILLVVGWSWCLAQLMVRIMIQIHRTAEGELTPFERMLEAQSFDTVLRLPFSLIFVSMLGPLLALVAWLVAFRKPPLTRRSFEVRRSRLHWWLGLLLASGMLFGLSYRVILPLAYDEDWLLYIMGSVFAWIAYAGALFTALRLQRARHLAGVSRLRSWVLAAVTFLVLVPTTGAVVSAGGMEFKPITLVALAVPVFVAWAASRDRLSLPEDAA